MLVALIAKSAQVPLHTWIPDAMAAPTPVNSLMHAASYVTGDNAARAKDVGGRRAGADRHDRAAQ